MTEEKNALARWCSFLGPRTDPNFPGVELFATAVTARCAMRVERSAASCGRTGLLAGQWKLGIEVEKGMRGVSWHDDAATPPR